MHRLLTGCIQRVTCWLLKMWLSRNHQKWHALIYIMHVDQILLVTCMVYLHYEFGVKVTLCSEVLLSEA